MTPTNLVNPSKCGCRNGVACRLCVLEAARLGGSSLPAYKTRPPCKHLGDVTDGCNTCGAGAKTRECDLHGTCTMEKTAGKSLSVCATCPDYVPDPTLLAKAAVGPAYGPTFIPTPVGPMPLPVWRPVPPPVIEPTKPRLILTAVFGEDAEDLHACTGPGQRRYAKRAGAEYVVLRNKTQDPRVPCVEKWRMKDYVPHYPGGTLWLDADVFVMPDAPDIFDAVPEDQIGMVNVEPRTPMLRGWATGEQANVCRSQGVPTTHETRYWNSGVWIGRPRHAGYWTPPTKPFPVQWCVEELWCRWNVAALGLSVFDMDPRFNWTWPEDRQFKTWADRRPWFVHLAGMGNMEVPGWTHTNKEWRVALLRLLAAVAES